MPAAKAIYGLVVLSAIIELVTHPKNYRMCKSSGTQM